MSSEEKIKKINAIQGDKKAQEVIKNQKYKDLKKAIKGFKGKINCDISQSENLQSCNNGGTTDYYQLNPNWKQAQDIIEARDMNFSQGNILKAAFCFNTPRHSGTNYERELNKIIWFAKRELERISK